MPASYLHRFLVAVLLAIPATAGPPERGPKPHLVDVYGDPLPEGAVVRLGCARLCHPWLKDFALLADGKTAVTVGEDQMARRWDLLSGRQTSAVRLPITNFPEFRLAVSSDGAAVAIYQDNTLRVCDTQSGHLIWELKGANEPDEGFAVSPKGSAVAIGQPAYHITIVDRKGRRTRRIALTVTNEELPNEAPPRFRVRFALDGRRVLAAGTNGATRLAVIDVASGRELFTRKGDFEGADISSDGSLVAACEIKDKGRRARSVLGLYDVASPSVKTWETKELDPDGFQVSISPDSKVVACSGYRRGCLVDINSGRALRPVPYGSGGVRFSADGSMWAAENWHRLEVWDARSGRPLYELPERFRFDATAVSPDARWLAEATYSSRTVRTWDLMSGRLARSWPIGPDPSGLRELVFADGGRTLVGCHSDGVTRSWKSATGRGTGPIRIWGGAEGSQLFQIRYALLPHGKRLAALIPASQDGKHPARLDVWDAGTGTTIHRHTLPPGSWKWVNDWLPDQSAVLIGSDTSTTCVDPATGKVGLTFQGSLVASVSADSRHLATWKTDPIETPGPVTVWEVASGWPVLTVQTESRGWRDAALASDLRAVIGVDCQTLRMVDLATGKDRGRWELPNLGFGRLVEPPVTGVLLLPGDRKILTALEDGTALLWDLAAFPPPKLADKYDDTLRTTWWNDLAGGDAKVAYVSGWKLSEGPAEDAMRFLRQRLKPVREPDAREVNKLVADLDHPAFRTREDASKRLTSFGPVVLPSLEAARKKGGSSEFNARLDKLIEDLAKPVPPAKSLQAIRAIAVLERIGTDDARHLLEELARGAQFAPETRAAQSALARMRVRLGSW